MSKKPLISSASWYNRFHDDKVDIYQDLNDFIFFKVVITGLRPKYFYNETAHSDVARYCADKMGIRYWRVLE